MKGAGSKTTHIHRQYKWSCPFEISAVQQLSLKIVARELDPDAAKLLGSIQDSKKREELMKELNEAYHLRVICKTDLGGGTIEGSLFAVIGDAEEDQCEYVITNESKRFSLAYSQHILASQIPQKVQPLLRCDFENEEQCLGASADGTVSSTPYAWASVLHHKLLRVSFKPASRPFKLVLQDLTAK